MSNSFKNMLQEFLNLGRMLDNTPRDSLQYLKIDAALDVAHAAVIGYVSSLEAATTWIPVEKGFPQKDPKSKNDGWSIRVLACDQRYGWIEFVKYSFGDKEWYTDADRPREFHATHWMPVPKLPDWEVKNG